MCKGLVSIIIPTYNRACYISETIKTVLDQTYQSIEIIIIDDGSTDSTRAVVQAINDSRIRYISQENSGLPAVARNHGLRIARGEYIAFLDSDDLWMPDKLEKQISAFNFCPGLLAVATNGIAMKNSLKKNMFTMFRNARPSFRQMLNNNMVINSSVLMRTDVIREVGFLDEDKRLKTSEDYDYWLRILYFKDNSILILKDRLIIYRLHESNILNPENKRLIEECVQLIFAKYKDIDQDYMRKAYNNLIRPVMSDRYTIAVRHGEVKSSEILAENSLGFSDKISIIAKYYLLRFVPYLRKRAFRDIK